MPTTDVLVTCTFDFQSSHAAHFRSYLPHFLLDYSSNRTKANKFCELGRPKMLIVRRWRSVQDFTFNHAEAILPPHPGESRHIDRYPNDSLSTRFAQDGHKCRKAIRRSARHNTGPNTLQRFAGIWQASLGLARQAL